MLPKFELVPIITYFIVLPKVFRPSKTPSLSTVKLLRKSMMSADSFATSTALSTDIPTSDILREDASLIPSPRNPTTWPLFFNTFMILSFSDGDTLAKMFASSTTLAKASFLICEISLPRTTPLTSKPNCSHIFFVTNSLSPVRIFNSTPALLNSCVDFLAVPLGGSMNATKPKNVMSLSSSTEYTVFSTLSFLYETPKTLNPSELKLQYFFSIFPCKSLVKSNVLPASSQYEQTLAISSGAPLAIRNLCLSNSTATETRFLMKSNGTSSTFW